MKTFSQIIIIYNPTSTGDSKAAAVQLKQKLENSGTPTVLLVPTKYEGHAEQLAYDFAIKYRSPLIISSSGDGGYHEVVNGLMRAKAKGATPYAEVLPTGNANDHHEATATKAIDRAIMAEKPKPIDVLEVRVNNDVRYGHSYVGIGLTPAVATELNEHSLNPIKEIAIVLRHIFTIRPIKIEIDGTIKKLDSLMITNIGRMAKVLHFKESSPDDGLCEVTYFAHRTRLTLLVHLLRAALFGLQPDRQVKTIHFVAQADMPMQIDGELLALKKGTKVNITVKKHALKTVQ